LCCVAALLAGGSRAASGASFASVALTPDTISQGLSGQMQYLEDPDGKLTLDDVRRRTAEFLSTDATKGVNFGYSPSAYWFRFSTESTAEVAANWLLEIAYPPLDSIDLYVVTGRQTTHLHSGDQASFYSRPILHSNFIFPIQLPARSQSEVFFRVTSSGTMTVPATLWQSEAFARHSELRYGMFGIYFGWLLALGLYNLMLYFSTRERAFLAYVSFVICFALASMSYTGLAAQFLWPEFPRWGDVALIVGLTLTVLFGANFTRVFLDTASGPRWIDAALKLIVWGSVAVLLLLTLMPQRIPTIIIASFGFAFVLFGPVAGVLAVRRKHPGAPYFMAAWSFFFLGTMVFSLRNTGVIPTNTFTIYAIQLGSAMEMLLLSFALADRMNSLRREKDQAQHAVLEAGKTLVDTLRRSEAELEARVAQRTVDLESANQRLRTSEDLLRNIAHHDPLTGLANRLLLNVHLQQSMKSARRTDQGFALLMIDLDGFKPINDNHGHDAGDLLLRTIAQRLTASVREVDLVARVGGDEFICVLDSVGGADAACAVGEKLIQEIGHPVILESGESVRVGASIGIALLANTDQSAEKLMQRADEAMYAAKASGKNCCRLSEPGTPS
jgi:diguanylate cyclase (GGDEF)-like protein